MNFTVVWTPSAEQKLADLWIASSHRQAVTAASARIDSTLAQRPNSVGTPVFDTVRSLVIPPLGVEYEVIDVDRIVYVLTVWEMP
ncbi:MAG TPA: type II toxin-antitoxin system RelE/ParE family toxin [Gemmataceae bacterium]|jgi:hypothetical protein|nr:type II toxin-antitoxin system RelE/ParE family toxin [Gemmataceae bacterium]